MKRILTYCLTGLMTCSAAWIATAQEQAPKPRFDHVVRNDFFAGFSGNKEAMARGMKATEAVLKDEPDHAEALVWHGCGVFSQAGEYFRSGDMAKGQEYWTKGLAEMDRAVSLAPDSVGVRVPRGAVLLTVSRFVPPNMSKPLLERGLADYEHVYAMQEKKLDQLGTHPLGQLLFGLAEAYERDGRTEKAQALFERISKEMPGTPYAKRSDTWLTTKTLSSEERNCIGCHVSKK